MRRGGWLVTMMVLFAVLMLFFGCGGGGGGNGGNTGDSGGGGTSAQTTGSFYTNPGDGRLFQVKESDGSTLTYMGELDSGGSLSRLTSIVVEDPDLQGELVYVLDDDGMPQRVYAPDVTFELQKVSDTSFRLTAFTNTDSLEVSIPVEIAADTSVSASATNSGAANGFAPRAVQTSDASMRIRVTRCGNPVENALLSLNITPPLGSVDPRGTYVGEGYYDFYLPKTVDPRIENYKKCAEIGRQVHEYCGALQLVALFPPDSCEELENTVSLAAQAPTGLFGDLDKTKRLIQKYCQPALLKHLPALYDSVCKGDDAVDTAELLCRWDAILEEPADTHSFSVTVDIPGEDAFTSASATFSPADSTQSPWELELPTKVSMGGTGNIYTIPTNPLNTEWYTAHATMTCTDPDDGTVVDFSGIAISGEAWNGETEKTIYDNDPDIHLDIPPVQDASRGTVELFTVSAEGRTIANKIVARAGQASAPTDPNEPQYHVFIRSGTGYTKRYGGYANYHSGYDYFYRYGLTSEIDGFIAAASKFDDWTQAACAAGPSPYTPLPPYPAIWVSGNVALVGSFTSIEDLDAYACENKSSADGSILCNAWTVESSTDYWDEIDGICNP
jgi:hypothetical protein